MKKLTILIILCSLTLYASAQTIYVDANGMGDYPTIQDAILNADSGDEIIVGPGVYRGEGNRNISFSGKAIELRSSNGPQNTVIDCADQAQQSRGFIFDSGEEPNSIVDGFTIISGRTIRGGAIYCSNSSPTIENCVIENCDADRGGGILFSDSQSIIKNCTIRNNEAYEGGGVSCEGSESKVIFELCVFSNNTASSQGGGLSVKINYGGSANFYNCLIKENKAHWGGGIFFDGGDLYLVNSTIMNNYAKYDDGAIETSNIVTMDNCIVWGNEPAGLSHDVIANYCVIEGGFTGYIGSNNTDGDPLLTADGHIQTGSSAINAAGGYWILSIPDFDGDLRYLDAAGDMGCDEFVDTDGDGLPDYWEEKYYGDPFAADANSDDDNDGDDALTEYALSTNPLGAYYVNCVDGDNSWDGLAPAWDGVHGPKATIQQAIDICRGGDSVVIADGEYVGFGNRDLKVYSKSISIISENGPENCVINCQGTLDELYWGIKAEIGENDSLILEGLTIKNASGTSIPNSSRGPIFIGGIYVYGKGSNSTVCIDNCIVTETFGMGIYILSCENVKISDCDISYNTQGGLCTYSNNRNQREFSYIDITNCRIYGNYTDLIGFTLYCGGGYQCEYNKYVNISNCVVTGNWVNDGRVRSGVAVAVAGQSRITNCTIADNMCSSVASRSYFPVSNCILWNNDSSYPAYSIGKTENCYIGEDSDPNTPPPGFIARGQWAEIPENYIVTCPNDMKAVWTPGDYHLRDDSPCIDAGNNDLAILWDFNDINDAKPQTTVLDFDIDYQSRFVDGNGDSNAVTDIGADEVIANQPPVAIAGPNQIIYAGISGLAEVTLDGSASYDNDGDELDYYWSWVIDSNIYEANGVNPAIQLPVGQHEIELVVDDGVDYSEPNYCTVSVIEPIRAKLFCVPKFLNPKSRGRYIITFMALPGDITPADINDSEKLMFIPGEVEAKRQFIWQSNRHHTQSTYIMAFFDRADCMENMSPGTNEISVAGKFNSGQTFYGTCKMYLREHFRRHRPNR